MRTANTAWAAAPAAAAANKKELMSYNRQMSSVSREPPVTGQTSMSFVLLHLEGKVQSALSDAATSLKGAR